MIRAFVALPVPPDIERLLETAQIGLRVGKLVPPENFHVTLAFLDKQPEPVLEDLHHELEGIAVAGMEIVLEGLGTFGGDAPRSLHAMVRPNDALTALRKKVRQAARGVGISLGSERFVPHVTLARFGKGSGPEDAGELQSFIATRVGRISGSWQADRFVLYQSHLRGEGPIYEPLAEYPLGTPVV